MLYLLKRLVKSQMSLFGQNITAPHHKAYDKTTASGKRVHIDAKGPQPGPKTKAEHGSLFDWHNPQPDPHAYETAIASAKQAHSDVKGPQTEGREPVAVGMKVMYRSPEMKKKRKGTVIGESQNGWHVEGQRQGYKFTPDKLVLQREHIWTEAEHANNTRDKGRHIAISSHGRLLKPEVVNERAKQGYGRLGMTEGDVLTHPAVVQQMKRGIDHLARQNHNIIEPGFTIKNGMVHHDAPESMDAYTEYQMAVMNSLRRQTANAQDEMVDEFRDHLQGNRDNSRIFWTMMRDGKTAALRHIKERQHEHRTHEEFNTTAEGDFEAGMHDISSQTATPHFEDSEQKRRIERDDAIDRMLAEMHPKAADLIKRKFGLGEYEQPQSSTVIAREMNSSKEKVDRAVQLALAAFAKTKGSSQLRQFLKSLQEIIDLRKTLQYEHDIPRSFVSYGKE